MPKVERPPIVDRVPRAYRFTVRHRTTEILVHKIGPRGARTFNDVEAFFLHDPEGIATTTLTGSYESKRPIFEGWKKTGHIPQRYLDRAFIPYHLLVEPDGAMYQTLPLAAKGAHEPKSNSRAIAIACIGDYEVDTPTVDLLHSLRWLVKWLALDETGRSVALMAPGLPDVRGHDDVRDTPKKCPGKHLASAVTAIGPWLAGVRETLRGPRDG